MAGLVSVSGSIPATFTGTATEAADMESGATPIIMPSGRGELSSTSAGGTPQVTKSISIACKTGTLGVSLDGGVSEFTLDEGQTFSDDIALQTLLLRGEGGDAVYQVVAKLGG